MSANSTKLYERISKLEVLTEVNCDKIDKMMTNDLPHIQKAVDKTHDKIDIIEDKVTKITIKVGLIIGGIALVGQILIQYIIGKV